jgi:hypothetical protein
MPKPDPAIAEVTVDGTVFGVERREYRGEASYRFAISTQSGWHFISSSFETREQVDADIIDYVAHKKALKSLPRPNVTHEFRGKHSPWGTIDNATQYGDGVTSVGTPSHGGFKLDRTRNAQVPRFLRNEGGWYEEDSEWAKVAVCFPDLFTTRELAQARATLKNWDPDGYEMHFGETIPPGGSRIKDERTFKASHAADWVVISALNSKSRPGMVECSATLGGERNQHSETRSFMVSSDEYAARSPFGFVIDLAHHEEKDQAAPPALRP